MSSTKLWTARTGFLAAVSIYFLWLTRGGMKVFFNPDDVMNLYKEWLRPLPESLHSSLAFWGGDVRPLGQLAYRIIYNVFGWHPKPFRGVCFALMVLNIAVSYLLYLRITKSDRVAAVALLAGCYHGAMIGIYISTGTIYDVLAQTFILSALLMYMGSETSSWWRTVFICILTAAAIQTKEMGFALPLLAGAYELAFYKGNRGRWPALAAMTAVCAIGFLGLRFAKNGIHFQHPAYTPEISWHRYLETTRGHLGLLFFGAVDLTGIAALGLLVMALAMALFMRSRLMIFGWLYFNLALLPLSFTTPRFDAYVLYVPLTGFALWVAGILGQWAEASRVKWTVTAALAVAILIAHTEEYRKAKTVGYLSGGETEVRNLSTFAASEEQGLKNGALVAVLNDQLDGDWEAGAIMQLVLNRRDIHVEHITCAANLLWTRCLPRPAVDYTSIVLFNGTRFVEVHR